MTQLQKISSSQQYFFSCGAIVLSILVAYLLSDYIGYRTVALLLLLVVSLLAMFFDRLPILSAAFLSALAWNFLFIPPKFTLYISSIEDFLLFIMYFMVALVNATLTTQIRKVEKKAQQRKEKERTLQLYKTLFNSLSHELRTPIATIIAATDNLQTLDSKLTTADRAELVGEISKASLRLNIQVENLLNMSRVESGLLQPKKDWCDVAELLYKVGQQLADYSQKHQLQIIPADDLPLCWVDYGLIEQILYNLIYNALQYVPEQGVITVKAYYQNPTLILSVEDNGEGIKADEISLIFDKFYRAKNTKAGGTGLGLSIVKGFTEAHEGTVTVENLHPNGAKFTVSIPTKTFVMEYE
jgi:two-component system sensor histidine kinase KdpD